MPSCVCQVGLRYRQSRIGRLCRSQCCMHLQAQVVCPSAVKPVQRMALHACPQPCRQRMQRWTAPILQLVPQYVGLERCMLTAVGHSLASGLCCCSPVVSASGASTVANRTQVDLLQWHGSQLRRPHIIACCQLTPVAHATHDSRAQPEAIGQGAVALPSQHAQHNYQRGSMHVVGPSHQRRDTAADRRRSTGPTHRNTSRSTSSGRSDTHIVPAMCTTLWYVAEAAQKQPGPGMALQSC